MWIETNQSAPNYHPTAGSYPAVAEYQGSWNIPSGNPVSGVASTYASGANETLDFVLPAPVTLNANQIYHIIFYVDMAQDGVGVEGEVDPNTGVVAGKLRLRQMNLQPCGDFPWPVNPYRTYYLRDGNIKNQGNYRNDDGVALKGGSASNVAVGDDGMGHLFYIGDVGFAGGIPTNKWVEGSTAMEGYNAYAKYSEPYFDSLLEQTSTGFGQGSDAALAMAVTQNPQGEQFVAPANMGVDHIAMYIRKNDLTTTDSLSLELRDGAGMVLASGSKTAAQIPDAWDLPLDPITYPQPPDEHQRWGWIVVDLGQVVNLTGGQSYQVTCTTTDATGTAYQFRVQDFSATGYDVVDPASSFMGTSASLIGDSTKDALFLIPEPATIGLLVLGGLALIRRRR
jgi:hypothetical protein